jgi:hypothetical protein
MAMKTLTSLAFILFSPGEAVLGLPSRCRKSIQTGNSGPHRHIRNHHTAGERLIDRGQDCAPDALVVRASFTAEAVVEPFYDLVSRHI